MQHQIMKHKFFTALLLITLLLLTLGGCGEKAQAVSLYDRGLALIDLMAEMTRTEGYVDVYTADGAIREIVLNISKGDYSAPTAVYAITMPEETLAAMAELDGMDGTSDALQTLVRQRALGSLMPQVNGAAGVEALAAASICTLGSTFVHTEPMEDVIYLYVYQDAFPVSVTFTAGMDGTVSASGIFLLNEAFPCDSAASIETFFTDIPVQIAQVSGN